MASDSKRKAVAGASEAERAPKRRKGGPESPESTTESGLKLLESIRKVADKYGRKIAGKFEYLPSREELPEYYARIAMPISLKTVERKLHQRGFASLSELESFFKRMVTNNKDFYKNGTEHYEDTERIRKALSNYMRSNNPAYSDPDASYTCVATPIPPGYLPVPEDFAPANHLSHQLGEKHVIAGRDADADADADEEPDEPSEDSEDEQDGQGGEADDKDEEQVKSKRRIVLKGRATARPAKRTPQTTPKPARGSRKPEYGFEGVSYKGLTFQKAQEKIVEELMRKPDEHGEPFFLDFLNLPSRQLKEYFAVITDPLSLIGLKKLCRGVHGRHTATGVSDFKSWDQFEKKAGLLWENAHHFNEEGSDIFNLATHLKDCFYKELNEAKALVEEPPQPARIKLKTSAAADKTSTPAPGKKVTIHVGGGGRGSAALSPVPATAQAGAAAAVPGMHSTPWTRDGSVAPAQAQTPKPKEAVAAQSPSPSAAAARLESRASPARPNGAAVHPSNATNGVAAAVPMIQQQQFAPAPMPIANGHAPALDVPPYETKHRAPGKILADALIHSVTLRTHPNTRVERRFRYELSAHPTLTQQSVTITIPAAHKSVQIIPRIAPLEQQMRQYRLFVMLNNATLHRAAPLPVPDDPLPANAIVYDGALQPGVNTMQLHLIAAAPGGEKTCELEKFSVIAHLLKN